MADSQAPLSDGERAELNRLRAQAAAAGTRSGSRRWRTFGAAVLVLVGCLLAPVAVVAVWANNQVSNTDRYVETVAPLAAGCSLRRQAGPPPSPPTRRVAVAPPTPRTPSAPARRAVSAEARA